MAGINVLLIGSGGREHAIAWKLSQSTKLNKLYIAPGNPGTAKIAKNLLIDPLNFELVKQSVIHHNINLVIVGPEEPLVRGLHDFFLNDSSIKHIPVIGPQRQGAMLEGSKDFAKSFMVRHEIPTAQYKTFTAEESKLAKDFLKSLKPPFVIKADGLAAGKGVVILDSYSDACSTLDEFFAGKFGDASHKVVIEEFLTGIELSVFVLTDGMSYITLPEAKDYKRVGVGDTGPNTGGMGAVSPIPFASDDFMLKVKNRIIKPTIDGLKKDGIPYKGFIFIGLMNVNGNPFVIEYNVRMGDPETEVVIPRIDSDLLELLELCAEVKLSNAKLQVSSKTATTVITVSGGYPDKYEKGKIITDIDTVKDALIFHAGTSMHNDQLVTSGGRVLACTGMGSNMDEALAISFRAANNINFEGKYFRTDIGKDLKR